jgi:hypothetical protein
MLSVVSGSMRFVPQLFILTKAALSQDQSVGKRSNWPVSARQPCWRVIDGTLVVLPPCAARDPTK